MKKHILFLARAFPPAPVIAAVRCWNMADQLRKHGWRLTVMTIEDEYWINAAEDERRVWRDAIESRTIECIRTGHHLRSLPGAMRRAWYEGPDWIGRGLRKAAHIAGIDSGIGWVPCLKERITSELMQSVDIILADGSPFSVFEFSRKLAMKTNRPYVLDFRDLWHCNPLRGRRSRPWEIASERRCVRDAAALITVSASTARTLKKIHNLERDVTVISNGFSPSDFQNLPSMDLGPYALVYAGSLYPPRPLRPSASRPTPSAPTQAG
ncbi:MAG TPA: glycosyltransferase [bacterium]|nr:glycosyltransferase [bacterium]